MKAVGICAVMAVTMQAFALITAPAPSWFWRLVNVAQIIVWTVVAVCALSPVAPGAPR